MTLMSPPALTASGMLASNVTPGTLILARPFAHSGGCRSDCCDKCDVTRIGNCTILGQEGCCGGTGDTAYCQLFS